MNFDGIVTDAPVETRQEFIQYVQDHVKKRDTGRSTSIVLELRQVGD